jgi:molybdopterin synthase sulfurtransferase
MQYPLSPISTHELRDQLENPNIRIIDVRPIDAYNGWRMRNEVRGGHIKGARNISAKWMDYIEWIEIIDSKGITPAHELIVYGYDMLQTETVARKLIKAGYPDVSVYHLFADEWSTHEELPTEYLPNYRNLVPPGWLHDLISNKSVTEKPNNKFVICHAHYQNRADYEKAHIPAAIDLDTNWLESTETWNRRSPAELKKVFEELGIAHDTTVILYGNYSNPTYDNPFPGSSAGQLAAFRCAFIMLYAGVKDVRVLNGGMQAWLDEGYETTTEEGCRQPVPDFGSTIPARPEFAVDLSEAKEILQADGKNLVCMRSWREYIGEFSGYHYIEKKGRIPGAIFANCGSDAYHMENYRNLDHTNREYHEIERIWAELGITPDKHNAFYCGTGWRGSEAFFNAYLLGWPRISVFDGGWFEWSADENNQFETGVPEKILQWSLHDY